MPSRDMDVSADLSGLLKEGPLLLEGNHEEVL